MVPAQHYFMGGVHVNSDSETTMMNFFALGETACNGVHGKNRLASNSLLESMVFAQRAARVVSSRMAKAASMYAGAVSTAALRSVRLMPRCLSRLQPMSLLRWRGRWIFLRLF